MNDTHSKEEYIYDLTENERMMIAYFRLLDDQGKEAVEALIKNTSNE